MVVPVIWVGPAVRSAAWRTVPCKSNGTFLVQDVAVSLLAGQGQIILPCAEKAGKKGCEATLGFDFRTCVFTSAPNDFPFSAERFYAFHKKSEKTPLVTSSTRASSQDNPKKEAFFRAFLSGLLS